MAGAGAGRQSRPGTWALLLALFAGLLAGCGGDSGSPSSPPRQFYGIASGGGLGASDFDRMAKAGVGSLRFLVYRPTIQPTRTGDYNWGALDLIVADAAAKHLDLLPTVSGTPAFEQGACTGDPTCASQIKVNTPSERAGWRRFLRALVGRYGPKGSFWKTLPDLPRDPITRWQIWNEQNSPVYKDPPKTYATLLGIARRAIKSVDPNAQVILGGMFGTPRGGPSGTAWRYLADLYRAGAGDDFDAVALHPYSPNLAGIKYQLEKVRSVLEANGDASKPTLITEIGWGSAGDKRAPGTGARGQAFVVTPERQAENLTRSFSLLTEHRSSWRIGGVFWFSWKDPQDPPPGLCAFCYSSGLYEANGTTPKPALAAFERFTRRAGQG